MPNSGYQNAYSSIFNNLEACPTGYARKEMISLEKPDFTKLKNNGSVSLGGTGKMYEFENKSNGQKWLFKPSLTKSGDAVIPFKAYIQEAAYKVQKIVDPDSALPVYAVRINNILGSIQPFIKDTKNQLLFLNWQHENGTPVIQSKIYQHITKNLNLSDSEKNKSIKLTPDMLCQLQREHVTDWLLACFDSHAGNLLITKDDKIIGIDKEHSFRFLNEKGAQNISFTFLPNHKLDALDTVFNNLYKSYATNKVNIDLNKSLDFIKRVEAFPDNEYREIFRKYAESLYGKGEKSENLLDKILERKKSLREKYKDFFSELLTQRYGKKQIFIFEDEKTEKKKEAVTFGRYDLFTNAHLSTVKAILNKWEHLTIGIIDSNVKRPEKEDTKWTEFFNSCDDNHKPSKNFFMLHEKIKMLEAGIKGANLQDKVKVVIVKRPEYDVENFSNKFPSNKYDLVFPASKEEVSGFDLIRNNSFGNLLNRKMFSVIPELTLHSSEIRKNIKDGADYSKFLPKGTTDVFKSIGGVERLKYMSYSSPDTKVVFSISSNGKSKET